MCVCTTIMFVERPYPRQRLSPPDSWDSPCPSYDPRGTHFSPRPPPVREYSPPSRPLLRRPGPPSPPRGPRDGHRGDDRDIPPKPMQNLVGGARAGMPPAHFLKAKIVPADKILELPGRGERPSHVR